MTADNQRFRHRREFRLRHPIGVVLGLEPFDHLIKRSETSQPARPGQALDHVFHPGLGVWSVWREVDDLPLMHPEDGQNTVSGQHRDMNE